MDALSDVLRAVRLTGAIFFDIQVSEPWVAETPAGETIVRKIFPDAEHLIPYHVVTRGTCWGSVADDPPVRVSEGDIIVFPHGDAHRMSSAPGMHGTPNLSIYRRPSDGQLPFSMSMGDTDLNPAHLVCGYLGCDARPFNPILDALPPILHVKHSSVGGQLTHDLIRVALQEKENPRAGGETILSKLSELMFLQAVREYIESLPGESTGWLAALRDRHIGAALRLMHGRPAEAWTLDSLAREVGLSRSVFAERFADVMGTPAMAYLGNWRLQLAGRLLASQGVSIAQAAAKVGYESEASFNRAFKKQVGVPPGAWRRARRPASPS